MLLILALVFILLVAVFAVQNSLAVAVRFFSWQAEISLVLVILGSVVLGAFIVGLISAFKQLKSGLKTWDLKARNKKLEADLRGEQEKREKLEARVKELEVYLEKAADLEKQAPAMPAQTQQPQS
ncbi:MAG: LapA family protein [Bacillota bacterium]